MGKRWDATHGSVAGVAGAAISEWIALERRRISGQKLTEGEGKLHRRLGGVAKVTELKSRQKLKEFQPLRRRAPSKSVLHSRWVITWIMVDGQEDVRGRTETQGYQEPDLRGGLAETSARVSMRPSHRQVRSLVTPRNGVFGVWTSTMPFCGPMAFVAMYFFLLHRHGAPTSPAVFGNCMNRRRFLVPCSGNR